MTRAGLVLVRLGVVLGAAACSTARPVRPLGPGHAVVGASLGGPLIKTFGAVIPTPILSAGGGYGLSARWNATAAVDATAALYGTLHVEPGIAGFPLVREDGRVPTLMLGGSVHLLTDFAATRVAPATTAIASWRIAGRHVVHAGADVAVAIGSPTRVVAGPLAGGELRFGHAGIGLELEWLAPNYDVEPLAPDWISPARHGYFSLLFGFRYYTQEQP
jgi:hypothetical protein